MTTAKKVTLMDATDSTPIAPQTVADQVLWDDTKYLNNINASDIPTTDSNVQAEIDELKNSVGDGKELVANAITEKGVATQADSTFQVLADNVGAIETLEEGIASEPNLVAENIKQGVNIFNVVGSLVGGASNFTTFFKTGTYNVNKNPKFVVCILNCTRSYMSSGYAYITEFVLWDISNENLYLIQYDSNSNTNSKKTTIQKGGSATMTTSGNTIQFASNASYFNEYYSSYYGKVMFSGNSIIVSGNYGDKFCGAIFY